MHKSSSAPSARWRTCCSGCRDPNRAAPEGRRTREAGDGVLCARPGLRLRARRVLPDPTLGQNTSTRLNTAAPTTGP
jgi:hypothetical protein